MGPKANRRIAYLLTAISFVLFPAGLWAQSEEPAPVPLGDVARSLRKQNQEAPAHTVIDNDNFSQVMDEAQTRRFSHSTLLFSFDALGKDFRVSPSPDVTCSLSFNANATALISDPFAPRDLPEVELGKLDGPAAINGDDLQIAIFNGTNWKLQEITVGLTIVRRENATAAYYGSAKLVPAAAAEVTGPVEKRRDVTLIYHIRGTAAPSATAIFKTPLNLNLGPDQEWHWAIVQARGVPPQQPLRTEPAVR
jgi:hypothetical protein